ncbi:MAG TPA: hypothetical protein VFP72_20440, partial [Kineosporiaceae bacterium]|nr:hypothetical protein [Kineosporiaceae bacterium]
MTGYRLPRSKKGLLRASWQKLLNDFVSRVDAADPQVWAHLRDRLLAGDSRAPVPARHGTSEPGDQLFWPADPGLLPDDPAGWPDLADLLGLPVPQPVVDQDGPDSSWLRRLVPDSGPSSAPTVATGQSPAEVDPPPVSPPPDRTPTDPPPTGAIPPGTIRGGSRKRARDEGHQPGPDGIDRQGSPLREQPVVGDLLDLGRARLDHRERLEDTLSREQDRPRLLLLTEGLAAALEQAAHTLATTEPLTTTTADLLATIDLWRRAALDAAGQVVDGLALGAAQNLRLHHLLQATWG